MTRARVGWDDVRALQVVACPRCQSSAHVVCTTRTGIPRPVHAARVDAYRRAVACGAVTR